MTDTLAAPMPDRPDWNQLRKQWPLSEASRFVRSGGVAWHIQWLGTCSARKVLFLHGTGASCHSMAPLMERVVHHADVLSLDLPGHGLTASVPTSKLSLPGMAGAVSVLLSQLAFLPDVIVGHSAGAAIALELVTHGIVDPHVIMGINGALKPIEGNAVLGPLAKVLFINPLTPRLFAMQARYTGAAASLLRSTNSAIPETSAAIYRALMQSPAHVNGALGMMANWDLHALLAKLPRIKTDVRLLVARDDPMVPPLVSREAATRLPNGEVISCDTGGHLLHEADPDTVSALIIKALDQIPAPRNSILAG